MQARRHERGLRLLLMAASTLLAAALASPAFAYSSFPDYVRPIQEGGGGGRLFTGTPLDAHGCDVCHRGAAAAPLEVLGLPLDGYVPGQTYEIALQWPATTPHVAIMAEFTDLAGAPAGITALLPYASWQPSELCENGFPAADVCRAAADGGGCCRELDMTRDACSFPGERSVLWVIDCGSKAARVRWTAPAAISGEVWFSANMVTSDIMNDARGDGATAVRHRLRVAGSAPAVSGAIGTCRIATGRGSTAGGASWVVLLLAGVGLGFRRRARGAIVLARTRASSLRENARDHSRRNHSSRGR